MAAVEDRFIYPDVNAVAEAAADEEPLLWLPTVLQIRLFKTIALRPSFFCSLWGFIWSDDSFFSRLRKLWYKVVSVLVWVSEDWSFLSRGTPVFHAVELQKPSYIVLSGYNGYCLARWHWLQVLLTKILVLQSSEWLIPLHSGNFHFYDLLYVLVLPCVLG
jgi:hypothetical protein